MNRKHKYANVLRWTARIISLVFAVFISIFASDVFSEEYSFRGKVVALLMHLVPTFFVILILMLAWRREWIGGIAYTIPGILYIVFAWGKFDWSAYAVISGPLFLLGILFFMSWHLNKNNLPG